MMASTLQELINQYIPLRPPNPKGWQAVRCAVCNDHTRKGLRGAFLFDGDKTVYKCWNCGILATYNPNEHEYMTKKMITVLDDFGVPDDEWKALILTSPAYIHGGKTPEVKNQTLQSIEPKELKLPDFFYLLVDATDDDEIAGIAREYLINERQLDPEEYPYMLAKKHKNPRLHKWLGRVIMPIFKNNKLIYYVGREIPSVFKADKFESYIGANLFADHMKYETPASPKEKVLYGFERLFERTNAPLFVVEGWFDAFAIDGVATLGNVITPYQAEWLNRSSRKKIYIPDKFGDGFRAAEQALDFGWSISTPDIGSSCKDMDDAVRKYGKMYVLKSIMENKSEGFEALTRLNDYCDE